MIEFDRHSKTINDVYNLEKSVIDSCHEKTNAPRLFLAALVANRCSYQEHLDTRFRSPLHPQELTQYLEYLAPLFSFLIEELLTPLKKGEAIYPLRIMMARALEKGNFFEAREAAQAVVKYDTALATTSSSHDAYYARSEERIDTKECQRLYNTLRLTYHIPLSDHIRVLPSLPSSSLEYELPHNTQNSNESYETCLKQSSFHLLLLSSLRYRNFGFENDNCHPLFDYLFELGPRGYSIILRLLDSCLPLTGLWHKSVLDPYLQNLYQRLISHLSGESIFLARTYLGFGRTLSTTKFVFEGREATELPRLLEAFRLASSVISPDQACSPQETELYADIHHYKALALCDWLENSGIDSESETLDALKEAKISLEISKEYRSTFSCSRKMIESKCLYIRLLFFEANNSTRTQMTIAQMLDYVRSIEKEMDVIHGTYPMAWALIKQYHAQALICFGTFENDLDCWVQAVDEYDQALTVYNQTTSFDEWHKIIKNKTKALMKLGTIRKDPDCLEKAIRIIRNRKEIVSLSIFDRVSISLDLISIYSTLGNIINSVENIMLAVNYVREAKVDMERVNKGLTYYRDICYSQESMFNLIARLPNLYVTAYQITRDREHLRSAVLAVPRIKAFDQLKGGSDHVWSLDTQALLALMRVRSHWDEDAFGQTTCKAWGEEDDPVEEGLRRIIDNALNKIREAIHVNGALGDKEAEDRLHSMEIEAKELLSRLEPKPPYDTTIL